MAVFQKGLTLLTSVGQEVWANVFYGLSRGCVRTVYKHLSYGLCLILVALSLTSISLPALAGANDDLYDGNIFALYAGNGALVPPRMNLTQSLAQHKPTLLFFFVDDSRDCKQSSFALSQLQAPYGRVVNFVPVMADSILFKDRYEPNEPGYYFNGGEVPQSVIFDEEGTVRFDHTGELIYEEADDIFRQIFDLLPRNQSVELRRRPVNELNTELIAD